MADSLILKGVHDIRKHTGDDLALIRPKGSANAQHSLKKWWINGQVSTQYVKATVLSAKTTNGTVKLAVETSPSSVIRIDYDGAAFAADDFIGVNGVDHVGVFTEDFELIEYYIMPRLAGGAVTKVTPSGAASYPAAPAPTVRGGQGSDTLSAGPTAAKACPPKTAPRKRTIVTKPKAD